MSTTVILAIVCVFLAALLAAIAAGVGYAVKQYVTGMQRRDATLAKLTQEVALLNQGATLGAQALIRGLASRLDTAEDALEQYGDRLSLHRTRLEILRTHHRDIPPSVWGPEVA